MLDLLQFLFAFCPRQLLRVNLDSLADKAVDRIRELGLFVHKLSHLKTRVWFSEPQVAGVIILFIEGMGLF